MTKINKINVFLTVIVLGFASCKNSDFKYDASGVFEATEVIISSEASGKLEMFDLKEGDRLQRGQYLGYIDSTQLYLKKLQLIAVQKAVSSRKPNVAVQISATREQIAKAETEKTRVENLFRDNAATQKQVDDAVSQLNVLKKNLDAQISSLSVSVNSLNDESATYVVQIAQLDDQIAKCRIVNPVDGVALNKYVEENEIVSFGKSLYRIADIDNLFLRVYIVAGQLENVKTGQSADIIVTSNGTEKVYNGTVTWISSKAEFTPKTIQTRDERENLVYAVKIAVKNTDGLLKIGMYADAKFN